MKEFTLYWTGMEHYEACPQRFLWGRGWGSIDVGGGPGRSKPKPVRSSRHHAIMGIVVGRVIENLYNNELWREPKTLAAQLQKMTEREFTFEVSKKGDRNFIDWRLAPSKAEMLQTCTESVLGFLRTMKHNRLLGPYARAEVELLGWINKYNPVGGRVDLLIRRDDTGISILDGKNSKEKGKYTTPDQLRFYALCFYLAYGKLPDRVGFIYFRFPADPEKGETGIDWMTCTREDVEGLAQRAVDARRSMDKEQFPATPSPTTCKYCDYETVCPARQAQKEANRRKTKKKGDDLDDVVGFVDLDL